MKNVAKIIEIMGGFESFTSVTIENEPYIPLSIERIGTGPRGLPVVSVCHYGESNGDAMRDPEMTFEVSKDGEFHPISFRNDWTGTVQEGERGAVFQNDAGQVLIRPRLVKELKSFAFQWNRNIGQQDFIPAAKKLAKANAATN